MSILAAVSLHTQRRRCCELDPCDAEFSVLMEVSNGTPACNVKNGMVEIVVKGPFSRRGNF